jgi:hypothetical protein
MRLTLAHSSARLRCAECSGPLRSVKPWRQADVLGKPLGRRRQRRMRHAMNDRTAVVVRSFPVGQHTVTMTLIRRRFLVGRITCR